MAEGSGIQLFASVMPVCCMGKSLPSQGTFVTTLILTCLSKSCSAAPVGWVCYKAIEIFNLFFLIVNQICLVEVDESIENSLIFLFPTPCLGFSWDALGAGRSLCCPVMCAGVGVGCSGLKSLSWGDTRQEPAKLDPPLF